MISKDDFASYVHTFVHEFYEANPTRELLHTFIGAGEEEMSAVQVTWSNREEQLEVLKGLHAKYKALGIQMYAYIGEGWCSVSSIGTGVAPSESEDRREIVTVLVHAKENGKPIMTGRGYFLKRNSNNHITLETMPGDMAGSRISMLLWDNPQWERMPLLGVGDGDILKP